MKIGTQVKFTRRNGEGVTGRVSSAVRKQTNGEWLDVNIGDKKNPRLVTVRPSQLARA